MQCTADRRRAEHSSSVARECEKKHSSSLGQAPSTVTLVTQCAVRDKPAGDKKGAGKQAKGNPSQALNRLLKYLLPIAGKRILVLFALAIVRTALSNRLARMQVLSLGPFLLVVVGEASKNAVCVNKRYQVQRQSGKIACRPDVLIAAVSALVLHMQSMRREVKGTRHPCCKCTMLADNVFMTLQQHAPTSC